MGWLTLVLLVATLQDSFSILFPIKKPDGSVDMDSLVNHIALLEQTVATLKQDVRAQSTEISSLNGKVGLLQSLLGTRHLTSEVNSLKDELFATKTELRSVSSEVISVNAGLKTMTSNVTSLQIQINDTDKVVQGLQVSIQSGMQLFNSSLQAQINTTHAVVREVSTNKYTLQSFQKNLDAVNSSSSGALAHCKQTAKTVTFLQHETSDLQAKLNSTQITLKDRTRLLDNVVNTLNATMKDTSLLKTDVTLMNRRVSDLHTTSNMVSAMSSRIDTMNRAIQTQTAVTSGQINRNMNSLQTIKTDLATVNSTFLQSATVLMTELTSLISSVRDQKLELGTALNRFNTTAKDTSLLKTDVALINSKVLTMTGHLQTTAQALLGMSFSVGRLNTEVSFEVMSPSRTYTPKAVIQFRDVKHNVGGGYSLTSGKFTAPVSGIYLFWSQIDKTLGATFDIYLHHNTNVVTYSLIPVDGDVTGSIITSIKLNARDTVHVTASTSHIGSGGWSRFGGVLLRRH